MALSLQRYTYDSTGLNAILKERNKKERDKSMATEIKIGDLLNEVLMIEILSWLPVKSLLQFKTVCKSWFAVISSPHFVDKHLKNYYNKSDSDCLLVQYCVGGGDLPLLELLVDKTPRMLANAELDGLCKHGMIVCGPCDGIYYLSEDQFGMHALWNPAISELKPLPPIIPQPNLPSHLTYYICGIYGFGLDPITRDYKVVLIKAYFEKTDEVDDIDYPSSVHIYSLRTGSWRYWGDLTRYYDLDNNVCYIYVNGCCYWLGSFIRRQKSPVVILSFDMATDAFQEIQPPNYEQPASNSLGIYDASIAFLTLHEIEKRFVVWTWNEGIWTKKFTTEPLLDVRRPLGHWKNNKLMLESDERRLLLCDPHAGEVRDLGLEGHLGSRWFLGLCVYMESLVSITDRNRWRQDNEAETDNDQ